MLLQYPLISRLVVVKFFNLRKKLPTYVKVPPLMKQNPK